MPVLAAYNEGQWKVATRLRGTMEVRTPHGDWTYIHQAICIKDGDRVRTLAKSYARVDTMDYRYVMMGPFTVVRLEDLPVTAMQVKMARFHKDVGEVIAKTKGFWRGESSFEVKTTKAVLAARGTGFSVFTAQRIAFVNGNDLWLMNDDGSGRTNLLTAPPGGRIGRFAFAPDGSRIVYEVWQPASGEPEKIDLWTALTDGTSAHLLVDAGDPGDDPGISGYHYARRWCGGPDFSPDGENVSFLRTQDYASDRIGWYTLRAREVCRVPIGGGTVSSLFRTMSCSGYYSYYEMGQATDWRPDGTIHFPRGGALGARISLLCDASNTNLTQWPATVYAEYNDEMGLMPNRLTLAVGAQSYEFSGLFSGYGNWEVRPNFEWAWLPHPSAWQTPQMGAWFGPLSIPLTRTNTIRLTAGDGQSVIDTLTSQLVIQRGQSNLTDAAGSQSANSTATGLWSIPESGGTPTRVLRHLLDSFAWDPDGDWVVTEYESGGHTFGVVDDAGGGNHGDQDLGAGEWSSIGNWDDAGWRVVYWLGSGIDAGRVFMIAPETGDMVDLGDGRFPLFVPLYRTEVRVTSGTVAMTDTNYQHEVLISAGQMAVADDLIGQGWPQPAGAMDGPYVTNVVPPGGSLEPATGRVAIVFQFNQPIRTNSFAAQSLRGVSWPVTEPEGSEPDPILDATIAAAFTAEDSGRSFDVPASNLVASGVATFSWNAARTELTFILTNRAAFPLDAGNRVRVTLDLAGLSNEVGRALSFSLDETTIQMIEPVTAAGALLRAPMLGIALSVPPGAVSATPVRVGGREDLPVGTGSPTNAGWRNVGGAYFVTPAMALSTPALLELPVKGNTPGAAIWFFNGSAWSNLGGTFDASAGTITAPVSSFGTFAVFYPSSAGPSLHLVKALAPDTTGTNGEVRFAMRVWNSGRSAATNTTLTDALPAGFLYVTNSAEPLAAWTPATRTLTWSLGILPPGEHRVVWFSARVNPSLSPGVALTNIAAAAAAGLAPTNSDPAVFRVTAPAGVDRRLGAGGVLSTQVAAVAALGVGYRRGLVTITTAQTEDINLLNFAAFDAQVATNQAAGLRTYGIINAEPTAGVWPEPPYFAAAFRRVVERYDGDGLNDMPGLTLPVNAWELFDRFTPDSNTWTGCTLERYDQYLQLASALARVADPEVTILPSAVENTPMPGTTNYLWRLLEYDPAVVDAIDAFSLRDRWALTTYASGSTPAPQYLEALSFRELAVGWERPVWMTAADFASTYDHEFAQHGYTCTETDQAVFVARALPFALAVGFDRLFYNEVNARAGDSAAQRWAALVDTNGHRRMAFYTLQKLAGWLDEFTWSRLTTVSNTALIADFTGTNGQLARIVWDVSNGVRSITLPVGPVAQARVTTLLPQTWNDTSATWRVQTNALVNGLLTLAVSGTPVCVEAVGFVAPDLDEDGIPNAQDDDADGDGMPNDYETTHGLNPFVADAGLDADDDGMPNATEYIAGTDPQRDDSLLRLQSVRGNGPDVQLDWTAISGKIYRVAWSSRLGDVWSNALDGARIATGTVMRWTDAGPPRTPSAPRAATNRFYRVLLEPAP
jgi:uncharacterized repeat protein (TIGR01451 family)